MKFYIYNINMLFIILFLSSTRLLFAQETSEEQAEWESSVTKLEKTFSVLEDEYIEDLDFKKATENAIKGLLKELDPHSSYISAMEYQQMNETLRGNFDGIGIRFDMLRDTLLILATLEDSPAQKNGLMAGDRIVSINKKNIAGKNLSKSDISTYLKGKRGTKVSLGILRRGSKYVYEYTLEREKISIHSISAAYMATDKIGYIKLNKFSATSAKELEQALRKLKDKGMKNLILDLRNNGGGYLYAAIHIADQFLKNDELIVYTEGRKYQKKEYRAKVNGHFEKGQLAILVNENSASASEIVAGAVQDWDRGVIIGRRSFGKGLVQKPFALPDSSYMRLTIAYYYTPCGRSIQKPYQEGKDKYDKEIQERQENGELTNAKNINFSDSLKYYTLVKKREVYGGGGIMPDIFVPIDTSYKTTFYNELVKKNILNRFIISYLDENRTQIKHTYHKQG